MSDIVPTFFQSIALENKDFNDIAAIKLGLLALSSDVNSEHDLSQMLPQSVHLFTSRLANQNPVTIENLSNMAGSINAAVKLNVPELPLDVMMYGCTSGTIAIGENEISQIIQAHRQGIAVTNPVAGMLAALNTLLINKICVLNPYSKSVNDMLIAYFKQQGLQVTRSSYFNLDNDVEMTRVSPKAIIENAIASFDDNADALFISCTALRSAPVIDAIESAIKKPVITSNSAMLWHAINLAKSSLIKKHGEVIATSIITETLNNMANYGMLFSHQIGEL